MNETKKYWKSLSQLNNDPIVKKLSENEFVEELGIDLPFLRKPLRRSRVEHSLGCAVAVLVSLLVLSQQNAMNEPSV